MRHIQLLPEVWEKYKENDHGVARQLFSGAFSVFVQPVRISPQFPRSRAPPSETYSRLHIFTVVRRKQSSYQVEEFMPYVLDQPSTQAFSDAPRPKAIPELAAVPNKRSRRL